MIILTSKEIGVLGRLGNQLFQISSLVGLSRTYRVSWDLPIDIRKTSVGRLCTLQGKLSNQELQNAEALPEAEMRDVGRTSPFGTRNVRENKIFALSGYFQNRTYFDSWRDEIREMCRIPGDLVLAIKNRHPAITDPMSVGMHVRRGDYLNLPDMFQVLNVSYFTSALEVLKPFSRVFVASDDIEWCKQNLVWLQYEVIFLDFSDELHDFVALSIVPKMVMSNSTFSWWAAYFRRIILGHKETVAPFPWYRANGTHAHLNSISFYLEDWVLMHSNGTIAYTTKNISDYDHNH